MSYIQMESEENMTEDTTNPVNENFLKPIMSI